MQLCLSICVQYHYVGAVLTCVFHLGYEYGVCQQNTSRRINLLACFPSEEEISFENKRAKKDALSLAAFVGIHEDTVLAESELGSNLSPCDG